jgi:probable phosphoglycerate mutase
MAERVYLIRPEETEWSQRGQRTRTTDLPLTDNGRSAATRLRVALADESFALVLTSPVRRARQTCDMAGFEGRAVVEPNLEDAETPAQVGERVENVIRRIRSISGNCVLFAGEHILRALTARWLGLPVAAVQHFSLDAATVSVLGSDGGSPVVERWNVELVPSGRKS